mmetsp:Transcript_1/g.5  ORF Transcript_1/g.5 Transcript_1/m.5 type:complete len:128 (+) Transcript_1:525-908(+)
MFLLQPKDSFVADVLHLDGLGAVATKLFIDQCLWTPFIFLPVFFGGMVLMEGKGVDAALGKIRQALVPSLKANWKVWVPANIVNYSVVPVDLKVLFINAVSLGFTVYLSLVANRGKDSRREEVEVEG